MILRTGIGFELLKSYILCLRVISMSKFDGESIPTGSRELTSLHIVDFAHQSHPKGKNGIFKIHRAIIKRRGICSGKTPLNILVFSKKLSSGSGL